MSKLDLNIDNLLDSMTKELQSLINKNACNDPLMIGIQSGGVWIAERLHKAFSFSDPLGQLNIAFYRDDFSRIGIHPKVTPSNLPFNVEDRHIILVDDVLYTGRTIRDGSRRLPDEMDLLGELVIVERKHAPDDVGMAVQVFSRGMHTHVGA